jgi:hypothetical protein
MTPNGRVQRWLAATTAHLSAPHQQRAGPPLPSAGAAAAASASSAVVQHVELGCTNTVVNFRDGSVVSDFDTRLAITVDEGASVHTMTVTTAGGESFVVSRDDAGAESGLQDPEHNLEVNRGFEVDAGGATATWELSVIACPEWERLGDGDYVLTLADASGQTVETLTVPYAEPESDGGGASLPWPANEGFASLPARDQPLVNPVTFEWEVDEIAQRSAVYFAPQLEGEEEGSSALEAAEREGSFGEEVRKGSFGPLEFPSGHLEIELAVTAVRSGQLGATTLEITKGTVYSGEVTVA